MQVAVAVRDARRAGALTILETSAQGDHAGNGLAGRAGGVVRTLKSSSTTARCVSTGSKTIVWIIYHGTRLTNLDTIGSDGKVPHDRWRGRGHHLGRCVLGERVWHRVGPLVDRTNADDGMETENFVGHRLKSSEYINDLERRGSDSSDDTKAA